MPGGLMVVIVALLGIVVVAAVVLNSYGPRSSSSGNSPGGNPPGGNPPPVTGPQCRGTAACFTDTVTHLVCRLLLEKKKTISPARHSVLHRVLRYICPPIQTA